MQFLKIQLTLLSVCTVCCTIAAAENEVASSVARIDYSLHSRASAPAEPPEPQTSRSSAFYFSTETPAQNTTANPSPFKASPAAYVASPSDDDIWERIRSGFKLPEADNPLVRKWENYYASKPEYLNRIIDRSRRYLFHVVSEVEKRDMPMEIALLPMIESAYNPKAESPASAAGMWQFIPETGKRYGLERTWWYDGRRDVVAATGAALSYLNELHGMFGDWELALASYNWGEGAVSRAVNKSQQNGSSTNYFDLRMPEETRNYVPKLLAIRNIIANPGAFGIVLASLPNQPYFRTLTPGKHMDVKVAAELAEMPVEELLRLNPGFSRPVIAHKEDRQLVLPAEKVEIFQRNLQNYKKPLLNWQPYVTKSGEPFTQIASRFGISLAELKDVNDLSAKDSKARGQTILVPNHAIDNTDRQALAALAANRKGDQVENTHPSAQATADTPAAVAPVKNVGQENREYVTQKGDTLYSIARKFNVSVSDLSQWNKIGSKGLQVGSRLVIH